MAATGVIPASAVRPMGPAATLMSPPSVTFTSREKACTAASVFRIMTNSVTCAANLEAEAGSTRANGGRPTPAMLQACHDHARTTTTTQAEAGFNDRHDGQAAGISEHRPRNRLCGHGLEALNNRSRLIDI